MIEETILNYLKTELTVPVKLEMPEDPPVKIVIMEKTGSGQTNFIRRATFAFKSYAGSMYDAAALNEQVKAALDVMPETENIFSAKLNSDYNYTDTRFKKYRYQAVYDFTY